MNAKPSSRTITDVVEALSEPTSYEAVLHRSKHDVPMLSGHILSEIVDLLRRVLFPGYYGDSEITPETMRYHIGALVDRVSVDETSGAVKIVLADLEVDLDQDAAPPPGEPARARTTAEARA